MNISAPFIRRRIGTVLLTAAIALAALAIALARPVAPRVEAVGEGGTGRSAGSEQGSGL